MKDKQIEEAIIKGIESKGAIDVGNEIANAILSENAQNNEFIEAKTTDETPVCETQTIIDDVPTDKESGTNKQDKKQTFGKFKNPEELLKAYLELEKEFTKKSQKLKTLEASNDVKNYTNKQLREIFGVAPQKAVLFEGSVKDNLLWANENATDDDIKNALETSQSTEFVNTLKDGLDTQIAQGGKNLSGGQRQRLTIARALVSNPDILILDDSSSALDFATDAKLRKALAHLRLEKGLTTVVVSQRATSIKYCDLIVVLDEGNVVGLGTHDELIKSCDVYREICLSQIKEDEAK